MIDRKKIGDDLMMAAINCGHAITEDEITLSRDPKQPECSLTQLRERLLTAYLAATEGLLDTISQREAALAGVQSRMGGMALSLSACAAPCKPAETVDTPEFVEVLRNYLNEESGAYRKLIAHIDAHTARAVAAAVDDLKAQKAGTETMFYQMKAERDALGQSIADAALKAGMYNGEVDLSGPHLVMFAQNLADAASTQTFQQLVQPWMMACFGAEISADKKERNHRFFEEATELVQSTGMTASEAHQLVDYVYGRDIGEPAQEVGGVMVTLAALCLANDLDMHDAAEVELARIWTKVEAIRAKQAAKPKHSPLPQATTAQPDSGRDAALVQQLREYAGNAGYSHNDYADTMRRAAAALAAHPAPSSDAAADEFPAASGPSPCIEDRDGIPAAIRMVIQSKGSYGALRSLYRLINIWGAEQRAAHPANGAQAGDADPIRKLIELHAEELDQNDYAYFELARTRRTDWMAWICTNLVDLDPSRKVLATGQGSTPDEACANAALDYASRAAAPQKKEG